MLSCFGNNNKQKHGVTVVFDCMAVKSLGAIVVVAASHCKIPFLRECEVVAQSVPP